MYSHCLYCHADLGRNEVLESLPIGRRVAFDGATGRLWVVCGACERWCLTPFEERWEALEAAERAFRATRLRASTDNIGLARLADGTELVRVGAALRPEFAGWRYGDQFGRRRRRTMVLGAGAIAVGGAYLIGSLGFGLSLGALGLVGQAPTWIRLWHQRRIATWVTLADGRTVAVTHGQAALAYAGVEDDQLRLVLAHRPLSWRDRDRAGAIAPMGVREGLGASLGVSGGSDIVHRARRTAGTMDVQLTELAGAHAERAMARLLPFVNHEGGSRRHVAEALALIDARGDAWRPLVSDGMRQDRYAPVDPDVEGRLAWLKRPHRLALEMLLHESRERRALEGELVELERAWQEADAIAAIADQLTLPPDVEQRLAALRAGSETS